MNILASNKEKVIELCKKHKVVSLYLFGSATKNNFNKDSDIDFLVKFNTVDLSEYFINYLSLKNSLKILLNRNIDLIEEQALKNPILINSINKSKELIYG